MIKVKNLTKFYGDHKAVDNLTFSIKDGTVCGLSPRRRRSRAKK